MPSSPEPHHPHTLCVGRHEDRRSKGSNKHATRGRAKVGGSWRSPQAGLIRVGRRVRRPSWRWRQSATNPKSGPVCPTAVASRKLSSCRTIGLTKSCFMGFPMRSGFCTALLGKCTGDETGRHGISAHAPSCRDQHVSRRTGAPFPALGGGSICPSCSLQHAAAWWPLRGAQATLAFRRRSPRHLYQAPIKDRRSQTGQHRPPLNARRPVEPGLLFLAENGGRACPLDLSFSCRVKAVH